MARLVGPTDHVLELTPLAYKNILAHVDNDWDANWLRVRVAARRGRDSWEVTRTVILTCELHWLANWLDRVADTSIDESKTFSCLEPTFRVKAKHSEGFVSIHVILGYKFLPSRSPNDEITITFEPTTGPWRASSATFGGIYDVSRSGQWKPADLLSAGLPQLADVPSRPLPRMKLHGCRSGPRR